MVKKHKKDGEKNWQDVAKELEGDSKSAEDQAGIQSEEQPPLGDDANQKLAQLEADNVVLKQEILTVRQTSAADMDNLRKRMDKRVTDASQYALSKFFPEMLPIVDSLERGIEECQDVSLDVAKQGMQMTLDMLLNVMDKQGVKVVNPVGEVFNPEQHEAMSMQADKKAKPNTVLQVVQKGYVLHDRLIRPALVIVST